MKQFPTKGMRNKTSTEPRVLWSPIATAGHDQRPPFPVVSTTGIPATGARKAAPHQPITIRRLGQKTYIHQHISTDPIPSNTHFLTGLAKQKSELVTTYMPPKMVQTQNVTKSETNNSGSEAVSPTKGVAFRAWPLPTR